MRIKNHRNQRANGLVVVVSVIATVLAILGAAVSYTGHISRVAQRSRRAALALEIADGHLEYLFTNWRNIYRKTWVTYGTQSGGTDYSILGTNDFYTDLYYPGNGCTGCPAPTPVPTPYASPTPFPTPPRIALPAKSNFPTEANYNVTQYRIQAVDPMIQLDPRPGSTYENALQESSFGSCDDTVSNCVIAGKLIPLPAGSPPPAGYGPNTWQYSFYYLASVDVSVPAIGTNSGGTVTAKVRRVFEKRFDNPWTYGIFYNDDLEFQPTSSFTINGPIHTNGNLYIGNSNFTAQGNVGYSSNYVNGYSPNDTSSHASGISAPIFQANPPMQEAASLPFGWNLSFSTSDTNPNNDSYHDIIERPNGSYSDPLSNVRYYDQAGYRVVINADSTVTVSRIDSSGNVTTLSGSALNVWTANNGQGSSTTIVKQGQALWDTREGTAVKVANIDVSKILSSYSSMPGWTGLVYIADAGAGTSTNVTINNQSYSTTRRAIRLINGQSLPPGTSGLPAGLTIVSENPVYIQGDYNTGGDPPSNHGTYTDPDASAYTRKPAAVVADAVTVLSTGWKDNESTSGTLKPADNTTINTAIVAGIVPSSGGNYSGGAENFIRLLQDWSSKSFCYYGSMVELYASQQATGPWNGNGTVYKSPQTNRWYYDDTTFSSAAGPPGSLIVAAYLQQQRWYQVY
jgi:hypothetical protein